MEKKEIELISLKGLLVNKNEMQVGAKIFGYDTMYNLLCFIQIEEDYVMHILGMTNDLFKEGIINNGKDFENFLSKAKDYCEKYYCTYETLWDYKSTHNLKKIDGKVVAERKIFPNLNTGFQKIEMETTLENLQKANFDSNFNQNMKTEINH